MAVARVCSECGKPLEGKAPSAKTCSVKCRQARARRRKHVNDEVAHQAEEGVGQVIAREHDTVIERVLHQELQPVVREAINDDVLRAIEKMVGLTTRAVQTLAEDLESEDAVIRQRAASLVVKYTVGHPALVRPTEEHHEQLVVNVGLPRPDDVLQIEPESADVIEVEEETKICDICHQEKPESEFESGSDRCTQCHQEWRNRIMAQFTS